MEQPKISQRARLLTLLVVIFILGVLGQSWVIQAYLLEDFRKLEENQLRGSARLTRLWLDQFLQPLNAQARSAGGWVSSRGTEGQAFAEQLMDAALDRNIAVHSAAVLAADGALRFGFALDPVNRATAPLPPNALAALQRQARAAHSGAATSGWAVAGDGLLASAAQPLPGPGAPAYVVLGRAFNASDLTALEDLSSTRITLSRAGIEPGLRGGSVLGERLAGGEGHQPLTLCSALTPALNPGRELLCVQLRDSIYLRGKASSDDLRLATLTGFVLLIAGAWLFLDRALLRRLAGLVRELDTAGADTRPLREALLRDSQRGDELARLTGGLSHTLARVHETESELKHYASHDDLTGLYNRREFNARLTEAMHDSHENGVPYSLCYMDLDQFKIVNDICGHQAGDRLIQQIAAKLRERLRQTDTLARLGGDEFGLLLNNCTAEQAVAVADELRQRISAVRFQWGGRTFTVDASVGVVLLSQVEGDVDQALSLADATCYVAKEQGRHRVRVYRPGDIELQHQFGQMRWAQRLKDALEQGQFRLFKQGVHPLHARPGEPMACEILLRLRDSDGRMISAGEFLDAAERYQMMPEVDRWVLETLLAHVRAERRQGIERRYFVNLSGQSIGDEEFQDFLSAALAASPELAPNLVFEVTETAVISNLVRARRLLEALRSHGASIALDDFGTGMSTFLYLKELDVQYLKIAGNFVKDMAANEVDQAIVRNFASFAKQMKLQTIAEWVENEATVGLLREMGTDYGQGYALDQPALLEAPAAVVVG